MLQRLGPLFVVALLGPLMGCSSGGGTPTTGKTDADVEDAGLMDAAAPPTQAPPTPAPEPTPEPEPVDPSHEIGLMPPIWSTVTSDGLEPASCRGDIFENGAAPVAGMHCEGRFCDNVQLLCAAKVPATATDITEHDWFSEEDEAFICPDGKWMTGLRCDGDFCDNIALECATLTTEQGTMTRGECHYSSPASEEAQGAGRKGTLLLPSDHYVAGIKCEGRYCDEKRLFVCQSRTKLRPVDEEALAGRFAPRLRFDQMFGTGTDKNKKCFPSHPEDYYELVSKAPGASDREAIALCNTDYDSIRTGLVPTYYAVEQIASDMVAIDYWVFYAMQSYCADGIAGYHPADWEHITVLATKATGGQYELSRVAFHQHGGWYTRDRGGLNIDRDTHPVVFVGKNSHGMYHSSGGSGGCGYFADYRNPGAKDYQMDTWQNLERLRSDDSAPEWMRCRSDWELPGLEGKCFGATVAPPMEQAFGHEGCETVDGQLQCGALSMRGCSKDGCKGDHSQANDDVLFAAQPTPTDSGALMARHSGLCLDVASASNDNNAEVVQARCEGTASARFRFERAHEGITIRPAHSDKCLDVVGASMDDGAKAVQYGCNEGDNQTFFMDAERLGLQFQATHSGLCLGVKNGNPSENSELVQMPCDYIEHQRFMFVN